MPMLPFHLSGELRDFLAYLTGQCWPGTLAFTFAGRLPLLPVRLRSLDLDVEFGSAASSACRMSNPSVRQRGCLSRQLY